MTLIDKDELIRMLELCENGCEYCKHADNRYRCEYGSGFETACSMICDAEEIDEADIVANYCKKHNINQIQVGDREFVEVVRCKDCKFNYSNQFPYDGLACQKFIDLPIREDFFCAYGERTEKRCD